MKVYEINPSNFGKYKDQLHNIMSKPNMCGVFSNSCGHCEAMKPEWNKLKSAISSNYGNGSLVEIDSNVLPEFDYQPLREKISKAAGGSPRQFDEMAQNRQKILESMVQRGITDINQVSTVIQNYYAKM